MDYLKDKQHYIDRYDLDTIIECLRMIDIHKQSYADCLKKIGTDKHSKAEMAKTANWVTNQHLFVVKANRYMAKDETIQKWMDQDQIKQEKYDTTPAPINIRCLDCKRLMSVKNKDLGFSDDPMRVLFFFGCTSCKKRRGIYEDGKEFISKPLCPKCKSEIEMSVIKEDANKVIWKKSCSSCGFNETEVDDFKKMRAEHSKFEAENKEKENREKKVLESYREEYCSEEKGKEAYEYMEALKVADVVFDEEVKKYDSLAYQKVTQLKKLSVTDLQKQMENIFEKEKYINLSFGNPEINQHVVLSFNIQEGDTSRKQETSVSNLQKIIKDVLEGTNWRLMSEGISYRLGYMSGRLKGYEREEDFFELSGEKKEEEPSKIDYETRMQYEGNSVVKLAHIFGEHKGIDNVRQKRLKQDPEGFFLEDNENYYQCGICFESMRSGKTWWNLDGLRCADCQRNIKDGVIPSEIHKNQDIWLRNSELTSEYDFDINPSTVRKLRRLELLHGRDLKREDGSVYCTVYLIDENKEFLEKYPRKPRKKMIITDLLGEKLEL